MLWLLGQNPSALDRDAYAKRTLEHGTQDEMQPVADGTTWISCSLCKLTLSKQDFLQIDIRNVQANSLKCVKCKKYEVKLSEWKQRMAAREKLVSNHKKLVISPSYQAAADVRYRWAAVPGFSNSKGTIFRRSGDIDIHDAMELMSTTLLLFCIFPYCDPEFFSNLCLLVEIWGKIINPKTTTDELEKYRHEVDATLKKWAETASVSCLGIMFHAIVHIFDFRIWSGAEHEHWMFVFERFVSLLIRRTKSRAYPEVSLANEMAENMYIKCIGSVRDTEAGIKQQEASVFGKKAFADFDESVQNRCQFMDRNHRSIVYRDFDIIRATCSTLIHW